MAEGGTGATVTEQEWYGALDDETKGYMAARGLDKKAPNEALLETIKAHRNAEARLGAPADEMFRWKKDDPDLHKKVFEKLGLPEKADAYDLSKIKRPDGSSLEENFANEFKELAHKARLLPESVEGLLTGLLANEAKTAADKTSSEKIKVAAALDQLKANWGANYENNTFIANRALDLLGVSREVMNVLSEHSSFGQVMEGLLKLGRSMGESKLLGLGGDSAGAGGNRILTGEEAASKKQDLMSDRDWIKRWGSGDKAAREEMDELNRIIVAAHQRGYQGQIGR